MWVWRRWNWPGSPNGVAHPLIAEARQLRAEAGRLIARVRLPGDEPPAGRSNAARSLAAHRWGNRI